jgi:hypothetical protein
LKFTYFAEERRQPLLSTPLLDCPSLHFPFWTTESEKSRQLLICRKPDILSKLAPTMRRKPGLPDIRLNRRRPLGWPALLEEIMLATVRRLAMPALFCSLLLAPLAFAQGPQVTVSRAVRHAISRPLRDIKPIPPFSTRENRERPPKPIPLPLQSANVHDPVLQSTRGGSPSLATATTITGLGVGGSYTPNAAPPDTNGSAGTTQYVQWVNEDFGIYDKNTGNLLYPPAAGNTLWTDLGGACAKYNDGDPIVLFDKAAKRWVFTQFVVSAGAPYHQCVAVSTTDDATGSYSLYDFTYSAFNDYPKVGIWPDAYYVTFNMFSGNFFKGSQVCAWDRAKMLAGQKDVTQQCVQLSSSFGGLLPADLDGSTAPPAGSPEFLLNFGSNSLNLWKFHVDWNNSANSSFTGPTNIPVAAFSAACNGGTCIPQPSTTEKLDSLADRLMYRLAYRNFGDHDTLLVNHSVTAGSSVGVRWYELRNPGSSPIVFQQGTYAPDSSYRWMGSIAMDSVGDIAMGYSISSSTVKPSIRYTGRTPSDPLGTMQGEIGLLDGTGSQLRNLSRWGDYSSLSVDPVDDCTFWYTTEYLQTNGTFNWSTHISSFSFPGCTGTTTTQPPSAPTGLTATAGDSQVSLSWNASTGADSYNVYRSTASGAELFYQGGLTATSFTDTTVTNGVTYFYTVSASSNANGEGGQSAEVSATPNPPPPPPTCSAFGLAANPTSITLSRGGSGTSNVAVVNGSDGCSYNFTVAVSGGLKGVSASVTPASASGASAATTLTVSVSGRPQTGTATATVTATDGAGHTASVPVSITER